MKKLNGESLSIVDENIRALSKLFPEAVAEGKVNFDILRQLLGDSVEVEQERYSFTWNGKSDAFRLSQTPSLGTLRPCKEESKNWDTTQNLYIEGDNLEVLKLLQKSYYGKVKMIYIDPPYNTGNDFVYKDDFKDSIDNYKHITGQIDGNGHNIATNSESNGRFHTDWLNMIYPRLRLARNLLTEDGVIFISIDYNENYNLRAVCNEIFGGTNFIGEIYWESKTKSQNTITAYDKLQPKVEMILVYSKNFKRRFNLLHVGEKEYSFEDKKGVYREHLLEFMNSKGIRGRESMIFDITVDGVTVSPPNGKQWQVGIEQVGKYLADEELFERNGKIFLKMRPEYERVTKTEPFWGFFSKEIGTTESAKKELATLIQKNIFETVKPVELIKRLIFHATEEESIVMDFFSGSATTAHAVMQLNAEDGGSRKFIMVQLPELTAENSEAAKAGYENICEIGKGRIRRAGEKIKAEAVDEVSDLDIGFKVFKLDSSNFKKWNPQPEDIMQSLLESVDNFLPGRTELDVVYEILLKMGIELSTEIEEREVIGEKIYIVGCGSLMICLEKNITLAVADEMIKIHKEYNSELWQVVFHDMGFASDMDKTNIKETLKTAGLKEDNFVCV